MQVSTNLDSADVERLDTLASTWGLSRASMVRYVVREYLENLDTGGDQ